MYQPRQAANFKFIDLSDSESETQSDKENNPITYSQHTYSNKTNRPCTHQQGLKYQNSSIINQARSIAPKDLMQYSTLSLEDHSVDFQNKISMLIHEKEELVKQNNQLKVMNRDLQKQVSLMAQSSSNYGRQMEQYEDKMHLYEEQVNELRSKIKNMENLQNKTVKEYENKLLNYELPGNKHWVDEVEKIHNQVKEKLKVIIRKFIDELSNQKMNIKVQQKLTDFIKQLATLELNNNSQTSSNTSSQLIRDNSNTPNKFSRGNSVKPYRSKRISDIIEQAPRQEPKPDRNISQDYKLLSKSIEKLKHMEKEIDKSSGSYLKRHTQEDSSTIQKSTLLDMSSMSALDRSKSRRKRIFQ